MSTTLGVPSRALSRRIVLLRSAGCVAGAAALLLPVQQAAAKGAEVPAELQPLIDKIHRHAYKVTDEEIATAQQKFGDDRMFEIVVSAALGAANQRLQAGLKALDES